MFCRMNFCNVSRCLVPRTWQMFSRSQSGSAQKETFQYFIFTFLFFDAFHNLDLPRKRHFNVFLHFSFLTRFTATVKGASLFYILSQFLFIDLNFPTANSKGDARYQRNSSFYIQPKSSFYIQPKSRLLCLTKF